MQRKLASTQKIMQNIFLSPGICDKMLVILFFAFITVSCNGKEVNYTGVASATLQATPCIVGVLLPQRPKKVR